ncbi:MAG: hypothetical protein WBV82_25485 [Myxococcaceae bacterium]
MAIDVARTLEGISKSYFFTMMAREAKRLVERDYKRMIARQLRGVDLSKRALLRRAGLTTYSPVRTSVGASLLFVGGAAAGALVALSVAPMRGSEFRNELKNRTGGMWSRRELGQTQAPAQA